MVIGGKSRAQPAVLVLDPFFVTAWGNTVLQFCQPFGHTKRGDDVSCITTEREVPVPKKTHFLLVLIYGTSAKTKTLIKKLLI